MNDRQARAIASGDDALAFARGLRNPPAIVQVAMRDLETILNLARAATVQQHSAGVSVGGPRKAIANALTTLRKKHLAPIVSHGKTLLEGYPGIDESLKMPPLKASVEEHIEAAKRIREAVAPHKAIFIRQKKHSSTFIRELDAAILTLEKLNETPDLGRSRHSQTTSDVKDMVKAVRQAVADLGAQIESAYFGQRHILAQWHNGKRIKRKVGRPTRRQAEAKKNRKEAEAAGEAAAPPAPPSGSETPPPA
jgi:predicted DNA-binding protein (UPF0251 family)